MFDTINMKLLPMKGHYFLWNAGTGPVVPFLSTYAKQLGFNGATVGLMYTVMPFMGMLAKPLFGAIADRYRCQKIIFLTFILVTAGAFLATFYSPTIDAEKKIHFACDNSYTVLDTCVNNISLSDCTVESLQSHFDKNETVRCDLSCPMLEQRYWSTICKYWNVSAYCDETTWGDRLDFQVDIFMSHSEKIADCVYFRVTNAIFQNGAEHYPNCIDDANSIFAICDLHCDSDLINGLVTQPTLSGDEVYGSYQFWLFFLFMVIGWVGQAIVVSVTDAVCFEMLENRPEKYGVQRCFGALGWGISTIIAGLMMDSFSSSITAAKDYTSVFYLAFGLLLLDFFISYRLKYTQKKISTNILRDVGKLLTNIRIVIFMIFCVFIGMCTGLIWNFLFWLVEELAAKQGCDAMDWIKTLQGLIGAVQCLLGELPFFFLSGWILRRIGHVNAMSLILLVIGVRYVLYSIIPNPWWFLPIELTNGVTFGLFYASMASYASIVAPSGTETTVQGLVGAIFEGIGVSLGSLVGGSMLDVYGGVWTFRIFGIVSLILCLIHATLHFFLDRTVKDEQVQYAAPQDAINMIEERMMR